MDADARSRIMRSIRKTDTKPELVVRRAVHALGYRFRLHRRDLPGSPDLVLPRHRKVILVHGCFWHQHPGCRSATVPRIRAGYWGPKLARNVARDASVLVDLQALGWNVLVLWECELGHAATLRDRLLAFIRPRRGSSRGLRRERPSPSPDAPRARRAAGGSASVPVGKPSAPVAEPGRRATRESAARRPVPD